MSFPDFAIATADNVVSVYAFSNSNFKISVPKFSLKMAQRPLKIVFIKQKGVKLLAVAFPYEFRLYREKEVIYRHQVQDQLFSIVNGSFAKEQNCLILLYEQKGF